MDDASFFKMATRKTPRGTSIRQALPTMMSRSDTFFGKIDEFAQEQSDILRDKTEKLNSSRNALQIDLEVRLKAAKATTPISKEKLQELIGYLKECQDLFDQVEREIIDDLISGASAKKQLIESAEKLEAEEQKYEELREQMTLQQENMIQEMQNKSSG